MNLDIPLILGFISCLPVYLLIFLYKCIGMECIMKVAFPILFFTIQFVLFIISFILIFSINYLFKYSNSLYSIFRLCVIIVGGITCTLVFGGFCIIFYFYLTFKDYEKEDEELRKKYKKSKK